MGLISYKTASLLLLHLKNRENDLTDIIKRVLGIITILLLYFIIYYYIIFYIIFKFNF